MSRTRALAFLLLIFGVAACHKDSSSGGGSNAPAPAPAPSATPNPQNPNPTPTPSPVSGSTFDIYNDAGGILGDPNVLLFTGGGVIVHERSGGAPEGQKYMEAAGVEPGGFWGVTVDKNKTGRSINLSAFTGGALKFFIRINRELTSADVIDINITDAKGTTESVALDSFSGFDAKKANVWQEVAIPLVRYGKIDFSKTVVPFAIALASDRSAKPLTFDLDNIRCDKVSGGVVPPAPSPTPTPKASPNPSPTTKLNPANLYNDAGGVLGDPNVLLFTGGGLTIHENSGGAAEGSKYLRANAPAGGFWGITFDKSNSGKSQDLSGYAAGDLRFFVRVNRALAANEVLNINLTDANNVTKSVPLSSSVGFSRSKAGVWQDISIPISSYSGLDLSRLRVGFAIAVDSPQGTPSIQIDIDNVRWEKSYHPISVAPEPTPAPTPKVTPTPTPVSTSYHVYNDAGGVLGDPNTLLFLGGGMTIAEQSTGAPEGSKYLRASNGVPGAFWGITLDKNNTGRSQDLSAFRTLSFYVRLIRDANPNDVLNINLTDASGKTSSIPLSDATGFTGKADTWEHVSIPIARFAIDGARVRVPFALAVASSQGTPSVVVDTDDIRWDK